MSFADSASTLMNNTQALAAVGNVQLRNIIAVLENMMADSFYQITANDINADIPYFDASDVPDIINEVKGYLDGVLLDAAAIDGAVTNNASKAIAKFEEMTADLMPADTPITLPERSVSTAAGVIAASRALLETQRKRQEAEAVAKFADMNFPAPPGPCLGAIADIRLDTMNKMAEAAAQAWQQEQEKNVQMFIEHSQRVFDLSAQLVQAWAQIIDLSVRMISQLIADYEQSPLLHAEVAAAQASALAGAYAGLNRATIDLVRMSGDSYKAELAPYKLDVLEDSLKVDAYKASLSLTLGAKAKIASALAGALRNAGQVASSCLGSVTSHGSLVERSFS